MPDTTERKTYIVDVQSNLDEYIQEVIRTQQEVDELKVKQIQLNGAEQKNEEEIERNNAELRNKQKELSNARKMVDLLVSANKAQKGSYEELYRTWRFAEVQLKTMEGTLKRNADGTFILTDKYVKAKVEVDNAKRALDAFGKGIHNNTLNVGNYTESIQSALSGLSSMPGVVGKAGSAVERFQGIITRMAGSGGLGAIIAGVGAAITALASPFVAFFKYSDEGMDMLKEKIAGVKAGLVVLRGEFVRLGESLTKSLQGEGGENEQGGFFRRGIGMTVNLIKSIGNAIISTIPNATEYLGKLSDKIDEASIAAEEFKKRENELEEAEIALIAERARSNFQLREARLISQDATKSAQERLDVLDQVVAEENRIAALEIKNAEERAAIVKGQNELLRQSRQNTDETDKAVAEAEAAVFELKTANAARLFRIERQRINLRKEVLAEEYKLAQESAKVDEIGTNSKIENMKLAQQVLKTSLDSMLQDEFLNYEQRQQLLDNYDKQVKIYNDQIAEEQIKLAEQKRDLALKEIDTRIQDEKISAAQRLTVEAQYQADVAKIIEEGSARQVAADAAADKRRYDAKILRQKTGFEADKAENANVIQDRYQFLDKELEILERERAAELASVEYYAKSNEEKRKSDAAYTKARKALSDARIGQGITEMKALGQSFGDLAAAFAQNTEAAKVFGVAQATIAVYTAAAQAMADWKTFTPVEKIAAALSVIAQGGALINVIKNVTTTANTATPSVISSTASAKRVVAPPVGASVLTQPQISPVQASMIPNANTLTIEDFIAAISKMPAPVVTVEDINVRASNVKKVQVRANI